MTQKMRDILTAFRKHYLLRCAETTEIANILSSEEPYCVDLRPTLLYYDERQYPLEQTLSTYSHHWLMKTLQHIFEHGEIEEHLSFAGYILAKHGCKDANCASRKLNKWQYHNRATLRSCYHTANIDKPTDIVLFY
jgi:hypothetical protein